MNFWMLLGIGSPFLGVWLFAPGWLQPSGSQPVSNASQTPAATEVAVQSPSTPPPAPTPPEPKPSLVSSGEAAVQAVFRMGDATGWKLDQEGLGMTAAHVTAMIGRSGTVQSESGLSCPFQVIKQDDRLDLALLKLEGECASMPGLPVTTDIKEGDAMTAIGYPGVFGGKLAVNEGTIKAIGTPSTSGQPDVQVSDEVLYAGMSGGPCFTEKGVFGVVSNGTNPMGQMRPGDEGWCAEIPEGWTKDISSSSSSPADNRGSGRGPEQGRQRDPRTRSGRPPMPGMPPQF